MDASRFDALVRAVSRSGSRRRLLGGLAALAAAPAIAHAQPAPAACLAVGKRCTQPAKAAGKGQASAARRGKRRPPACSKCCSRFGAADQNGKSRCTCKGEGVQCDNDSQCCGGQCKSGGCTGCPGDTVFCSDGCADLATNNQHCGSCDNACAGGQRCQDSQCVCDATSCPTGCCDGTNCARGTSDSACGTGGAACQTCQSGQRCDGTSCVCDSISCPTGCCQNGVCHIQDNAACGTGGGSCQACGDGQVCQADGHCACSGNSCGACRTCNATSGQCESIACSDSAPCPDTCGCSGGICGTPPTCPGFRSPCVNGSQCCSGICGIDTCNCTRSGRTCHDTSDCCQNPPMTCIGFVCQ